MKSPQSPTQPAHCLLKMAATSNTTPQEMITAAFANERCGILTGGCDGKLPTACVPTTVVSAVMPPFKKRRIAPTASPKACPIQFLKKLFREHRIDDSQMHQRPSLADFVKPEESECECYNAAVRFVRSNNLAELQIMHENGKNLNVCNRVGESLLMVACRRGHVAIADFLIISILGGN